MNESIGYTVTLNIMTTFIVIVFAFLSAIVLYFKSNKVNSIMIDAIEKYEGYNDLAKQEIKDGLESLGYKSSKLSSCGKIDGCTRIAYSSKGYCIYQCEEDDVIVGENCIEKYYYYKVKSNMIINFPIINQILSVPIFSDTVRLYDFEGSTCGS